ncbi:MAG: hypothetical protein JWL63_425 [Rhodocyclales bacterium]|nr:hypothetical protein [Rhodocyclales bacterium]
MSCSAKTLDKARTALQNAAWRQLLFYKLFHQRAGALPFCGRIGLCFCPISRYNGHEVKFSGVSIGAGITEAGNSNMRLKSG